MGGYLNSFTFEHTTQYNESYSISIFQFFGMSNIFKVGWMDYFLDKLLGRWARQYKLRAGPYDNDNIGDLFLPFYFNPAKNEV